MNYIKLFETHSMPLKLYHGSFQKFDKFDFEKLSKSGSQTTYGVGIYLTDSKSYAISYINGENGEVNTGGNLYEVTLKPNPNFLIFGENINGKIRYSKIDSVNLNRIKYKLKKDNIELLDINGEPTGLSENDLAWNVYTKIQNHILENVFDIKQRFKYGDFYSKKKTSEFLASCGIDGMKYPLGYSKFKSSTDYGHEGYGYVIYRDIFKNLDIISQS